MSARSSFLFALALTITACSSSPAPPTDATPPTDTRVADAAVVDAPTVDAAAVDGGARVDAARDANTVEPFPETSSTPLHRIAPGAGVAGVAPGVMAACAITANVGGAFRLVCNGNGGASRFSRVRGSVWTTGSFSSIARGCSDGGCALEAGDDVTEPVAVQGGQRIDFAWDVATEIDGFDFVVSAEPAYFSIYMDGRAEPMRVLFPAEELGGATAAAAGNPFGLTTQ
jgi:hypothetical protein